MATPTTDAPRRVSQEEYDRMTPAQRWEYARAHDQSQFRTPDEPRNLSK